MTCSTAGTWYEKKSMIDYSTCLCALQFYQGGVFDEPNCYNEASRLTHSMLIIGYGRYKNKDYWLVKNRYIYI